MLDIMLPGRNGLDVLRDIRAESAVPVLMLTAKGDETDRIVGLEMGADDYLPKPFNPRELLARMNAVLRRQGGPGTENRQVNDPWIHAGGLALNTARQTVTFEGRELELSSTEYKVLKGPYDPSGHRPEPRSAHEPGHGTGLHGVRSKHRRSHQQASREAGGRSQIPQADSNRMGKRVPVRGGSMRPGKLYIKIFLSFMAVLVVTEILIFGFFIGTVGRPFKERLIHYTTAKAALLRAVMEERLQGRAGAPAENDPSLKGFITDFAGIIEARIWLTGADGRLVLRSFPGAVPAETASFRPIKGVQGDIRIHRGQGHLGGYYVTSPLRLQDGATGTLHILFPKQAPPHPEGGFALGLLIIGGVVALLVVPVSRFITKRVKDLHESSLRIAEGDLSHRTQVKGKDEIGELGRAFNTMAVRMEQMIQGTRDLTANVSHELRSPLARIRVAQELLRDRLERGETSGTLNHLEAIQEEVEILDRLIGRILALSRMDFQGGAFRPEETDLAGIVRGLLDRFRPALTERGLGVEERVEDVPVIMGYGAALETAVSNLFDNALRYTPEGGRVRVELTARDKEIRLSLWNSTEKLSGEEVERLFEPFYRGAKGGSEGSGLGLAISERIAEQHGGSMDARTTDGGLRVLLTLPRETPGASGRSGDS